MNSKMEVIFVLSLLVGMIALGMGGYNLGKYYDAGVDQDVIEAALRGEYTGTGSSDELAVFNTQVLSLRTSDEMSSVPALTN